MVFKILLCLLYLKINIFINFYYIYPYALNTFTKLCVSANLLILFNLKFKILIKINLNKIYIYRTNN